LFKREPSDIIIFLISMLL